MIGFDFVKYTANKEDSSYKQLLDMFMELLHYTNGDASEALNWLTQLDNKMKFTTPEYGIGDFIEDLKKNGYLKDDQQNGGFVITAKSELVGVVSTTTLSSSSSSCPKAYNAAILSNEPAPTI